MESQAQTITPDDEIHSADGWFQIEVPNDGLVAKVKKTVRHSGDGKPVSGIDILNKLKQLNVIYGIDQAAIENLIKSVDDNDIPEEPVVIAKGDIRIINSVINCHTVCQGIVYIGDAHSMKSSIVGNITHAYKGIESTILGSDSFKKTIIIAGAGIEVIKQLMDTTDELKKIKITLDGLERVCTQYCNNPKIQEEQNVSFLKIKETREIKTRELEDLKLEKENLKELIEETKNAKIIVHKRIYPGVKVLILNKTYEVHEERSPGVFFRECN